MKYQLTNRQMSSVMGDEVVILNHADGVYYNLEEVGAFVWEKLQSQSMTFEEIVEIVCEHYEVEATVCKQDIKKLLDDLIKEKLIEGVE